MEPFELDLPDAAAAISSGRLTPVDLLDSLLLCIDALEPSLHAWARIDRERARREALNCVAELRHGRLRGPLHGVPLGFKDIYYTAGLGMEAGSPLLAGFVPAVDANCVAVLRAAGAIVLGKTETTQFAMGDPAPTRNPYALDHTPGGSSSGSAAAVAARMTPGALGTQTAGSILRPAAFCGVVGFKPSAGRLSLRGIIPYAWSLDHPGPIARSVAGVRLLAAALDPALSAATMGTGGPPQLALLRGRFIDQAQPELIANLEAAAGRLVAAGANVRELRLPDDFDLAVDVHHVIMSSEAAALHAADHTAQPDAYRPKLRAALEVGALVPAAVYLQAQRLRARLRLQALQLFDDVDCLLMPSSTSAAPADLSTTGDPSFNAPWSLFGLPALALPSGLSAAGLPLSLQLIGAPNADAALLDAASWCESVLGPLPPPALLQAVAGAS